MGTGEGQPRGWGVGGADDSGAPRWTLEGLHRKMGKGGAFLTRDQPSKAWRWD